MVCFPIKETEINAIFSEKLKTSHENGSAKCLNWFHVLAPMIRREKTFHFHAPISISYFHSKIKTLSTQSKSIIETYEFSYVRIVCTKKFTFVPFLPYSIDNGGMSIFKAFSGKY